MLSTNAASAPEPEAVAGDQPRFTWRMIAARDYKLYIDNLRALGCPELTIQDIIIAAVNRDFAPRERALKARPEDLALWESPVPAGDRAWAMRQQLRELVRQKRALLEELLGVSLPIEMPYTLTTERFANLEQALAKVAEHKREAVRAIQEKYWDASERFEHLHSALIEPEDREARKKAFAGYWDALSKLLTPDELVDYDLARSTTARRVRNDLTSFEPSEQEFREIFRLRRSLEAQANAQPGPDFDGKIPDELLKPILGDARFAEYKRAQDPDFQDVYRTAQKAGLNRDAAVQAYEIQRATLQEQKRIMQDPSLTDEQRQAERNAIQVQAVAAMQQILGPVTVRFNSSGTRMDVLRKQ